MSWKLQSDAPFDFARPSVHLTRDDVHLFFAGETVQVWIGADEPMHGRLLLVADARGLRGEWQKGYTQADLYATADVLRNLGIRRRVIWEALRQLRHRLHMS